MRPTTSSAGSGATIEVEGVSKSFGDTQYAGAAALFWTILWSVGVMAIFAPLTVRRYRKG